MPPDGACWLPQMLKILCRTQSPSMCYYNFKNYKTLTANNTQHAKSLKNSKASTGSHTNAVASITNVTLSPNQTNDFIAAVFLALSSNVVGNGSYSEGSDNSFSSVSTPAHIKSKNFIWHCSLTGPTVDFPVMKPSLIDNKCHMVLIHPDIVKELGLEIFFLN